MFLAIMRTGSVPVIYGLYEISAHLRTVYNQNYDNLVVGCVQNTVPVYLENFKHLLRIKYDKNTNN